VRCAYPGYKGPTLNAFWLAGAAIQQIAKRGPMRCRMKANMDVREGESGMDA